MSGTNAYAISDDHLAHIATMIEVGAEGGCPDCEKIRLTHVPTAQDMYNEVMRRYDALPTQWGYALIYCWRQVASEWGLAGFQSPKEVAYAESYERLHLTKPLEFEGDFGCRE